MITLQMIVEFVLGACMICIELSSSNRLSVDNQIEM